MTVLYIPQDNGDIDVEVGSFPATYLGVIRNNVLILNSDLHLTSDELHSIANYMNSLPNKNRE